MQNPPLISDIQMYAATYILSFVVITCGFLLAPCHYGRSAMVVSVYVFATALQTTKQAKCQCLSHLYADAFQCCVIIHFQ